MSLKTFCFQPKDSELLPDSQVGIYLSPSLSPSFLSPPLPSMLASQLGGSEATPSSKAQVSLRLDPPLEIEALHDKTQIHIRLLSTLQPLPQGSWKARESKWTETVLPPVQGTNCSEATWSSARGSQGKPTRGLSPIDSQPHRAQIPHTAAACGWPSCTRVTSVPFPTVPLNPNTRVRPLTVCCMGERTFIPGSCYRNWQGSS